MPARGSLIGTPAVTASITTAETDRLTDLWQVQALTGKAKCNVVYRSVEYNTRGGAGEAANATTALLIPGGSDPACQGARPILVYTHGTAIERAYNMADPTNFESMEAMAFYAAQGYIVVAPNYVGYDRSTSAYHPYQNAEAQAIDVVDALRAAKSVLPSTGASASSKLFITGYSQGGFVAMATHRAIERDYAGEFTVTGSMPMSGSYSLVNFARTILDGNVNLGATIFLPLIANSYQRSYGNIYQQPSDLFEAPYANTVETLFPTKLKEEEAAALVPTNLFDMGDGKPFLLKTAARNAVREDFRLNRSSPLADAIRKNDLLDWQPRAAMALCGAGQDRMVYFDNATEASAYFASRGANVRAHDLRNRASLPAGATGDRAYGAFAALKAANPDADDHFLAPAGCHVLAASFFQGLQ